MQMQAQVTEWQGNENQRRAARSANRATRMEHPTSVTVNSRIGLILCLILGSTWGFLLGALIVRINSMESLIQVFGIALPLSFFGSMLAGIAFNRMLKMWKIARLMLAAFAVGMGLPLGFAWGLAEAWINPVQLITETGGTVWYVQGLFIFAGLMGGIWPKWIVPFLRPFANLMHLVVEPPARFFETVGRTIVIIPMLPVRLVRNLFAAIGETWTRMPRVTMLQRTPRPVDPLAPSARRVKPTRASKVVRNPLASPNHVASDGLRVMGIIEDRCPYCFNVVKRSDPRGVHVCEVCGTSHHADCWAITGKCQMPHLNT